MRDVWMSWDRLASRVAGADDIALILDFDGTLSPLAEKPFRARLAGPLKEALLRLNGIARCHLMVLSGRRLEDVRERVGIRSFYYGGNHGLELSGPGFSFIHPAAQRLKPRLSEIAGEARVMMRGLTGSLVENKGLSLSLHFRSVPESLLPTFRRRLRRLKETTRGSHFRWRRGHQVWELLPRVDWDKGRAVKLILDHLGMPLAVGIGDDLTDEDMFHALNGSGISIRTLPGRCSAAQYFLRGQEDTQRFLERFRTLLLNGAEI